MERQSMTLTEWIKLHPEYVKKRVKIPESVIKFTCQCTNGHVFDYRNRIKYPKNSHFARCQGKCPICGSGTFTFISKHYYTPFNYL